MNLPRSLRKPLPDLIELELTQDLIIRYIESNYNLDVIAFEIFEVNDHYEITLAVAKEDFDNEI